MSRSKYNKDFKQEVIEKGYVKELIQEKKANYHGQTLQLTDIDSDGVISRIDIQDWETYSAIMRGESQSFDCAYLLVRSKYAKIRKVKEKISNIVLNNNAVFLTLTFTDKVLESTSPQTRRRYVSRYLKSQGCEYVANIDFSPDIEREHYHAVIDKRVDLTAWKYGFSYAEQVRAHDRDLCKISKYITKLTAHALKVDATRLIYSRL